MSMLKLKPACTDYLWGGERLRAEYGVESDKHPLAEAWVLSCHPDGPSTIVGGPYDGRTLADYIAAEGEGQKEVYIIYAMPFQAWLRERSPFVREDTGGYTM